MLLNYEKKQDKERCECQGKFIKLELNNNQLLIEIKKKRQEVVALQNAEENVKQNTSNDKGIMRENFERKGREKIVQKQTGRNEARKK